MVVKVFCEIVFVHFASLILCLAHNLCSRNKIACFLYTLYAVSHVYDFMLFSLRSPLPYPRSFFAQLTSTLGLSLPLISYVSFICAFIILYTYFYFFNTIL